MTQPQKPNVADFTTFLTNVVGIGASYLPPTSPGITYAFNTAVNFVNMDLACVPAQMGSFSPYQQAVFNLGAHLIIEFAKDVEYPIASASWLNGIATVVTTAPHAIRPGDSLLVSGISPFTYDGSVTAAVISTPTAVGYGLVPNPGPAVIMSGAIVAEQYFANARKHFNMDAFVPGVIASSGDLSTSASIDNPEFLKGLTLFDLQFLKTPWGRTYLSLAQAYGPNIWGLT